MRCTYAFPNITRTNYWYDGPTGQKPINRLKAVAQRAGVPNATFARFRHAWATQAEFLGVPAAGIQRIPRPHDRVNEPAELQALDRQEPHRYRPGIRLLMDVFHRKQWVRWFRLACRLPVEHVSRVLDLNPSEVESFAGVRGTHVSAAEVELWGRTRGKDRPTRRSVEPPGDTGRPYRKCLRGTGRSVRVPLEGAPIGHPGPVQPLRAHAVGSRLLPRENRRAARPRRTDGSRLPQPARAHSTPPRGDRRVKPREPREERQARRNLQRAAECRREQAERPRQADKPDDERTARDRLLRSPVRRLGSARHRGRDRRLRSPPHSGARRQAVRIRAARPGGARALRRAPATRPIAATRADDLDGVNGAARHRPHQPHRRADPRGRRHATQRRGPLGPRRPALWGR